MSGAERIRDFSDVDKRIIASPDVRRVMAQCVTDMQDVTDEENYAAMLDRVVGSDDQMAAVAYGYLFAVSTDPRDVTERAIIAADVMRQSRRTMH
ncbi:hypothetical protein [Bradyrhizobium erythrophlei]|uniref:Uncharacterized protein n=1 Tax=Bradyrhizobium erythrophlei TaxID=1437360 RepID=A0A1M5H3Q2_9BRAD|nr:hypothetical protein [Bradyrhizobium erythrophlei]SHG10523.1 hypothetical protein SAMN05443248_0302 [Bradyrhizobium erythrophlei]